MVVTAFPAFKLLGLAFRQVSRPVANSIKNYAKSSPYFRSNVCIPTGQCYHFVEMKTKIWILSLGKPTSYPKLTDDRATELGANLLGEIIVFVIGSSILILEYVRFNKNKQESLQNEKDILFNMIADLQKRIDEQEEEIKFLKGGNTLGSTSTKDLKEHDHHEEDKQKETKKTEEVKIKETKKREKSYPQC